MKALNSPEHMTGIRITARTRQRCLRMFHTACEINGLEVELTDV